MELLPLSPPGNAQRKLRAYLVEIGRLRNDGYTIAVILETLEAQGVSASWSTVQREAKKLESASLAVPLVNVKRTAPSLPPTPNVSPVKPAQASDLDTFFQPGFDNPLFRKKKL